MGKKVEEVVRRGFDKNIESLIGQVGGSCYGYYKRSCSL